MVQGVKRGGRKPGSKNKFGATAKENVAAVFNRLGGTAAMARWAADNQTEFYKLYARLIPVEHSGELAVNDARALTDAVLVAIATGSSAGAAEAEGDPSESGGLVH